MCAHRDMSKAAVQYHSEVKSKSTDVPLLPRSIVGACYFSSLDQDRRGARPVRCQGFFQIWDHQREAVVTYCSISSEGVVACWACSAVHDSRAPCYIDSGLHRCTRPFPLYTHSTSPITSTPFSLPSDEATGSRFADLPCTPVLADID